MYYFLLILFCFELLHCKKKGFLSFSLLFQASYWIVFSNRLVYFAWDQSRGSFKLYFFKRRNTNSINKIKPKFFTGFYNRRLYLSLHKWTKKKKQTKGVSSDKAKSNTANYGSTICFIHTIQWRHDTWRVHPNKHHKGRLYIHRIFQILYTVNLIFELSRVIYFNRMSRLSKVIVFIHDTFFFYRRQRAPAYHSTCFCAILHEKPPNFI